MNWNEVLERAETQLRENPQDRDGSRTVAQATAGLGDVSGAIALMDVHLEKYPEDGQAWDLLSAYRMEFGQYEEAIAASNNALRVDPSFKIGHYNRACAYALMGKTAEALVDLEIAVGCDDDLRAFAGEDPSFDSIRERPEFIRLMEGVDE